MLFVSATLFSSKCSSLQAMAFDFAQIQSVEFGVSVDTNNGESFRLIPTVREVQNALKEMAEETRKALFNDQGALDDFSPAEKYSQNERLKVKLESEMVAKHRSVYEAENLSFDIGALSDPTKLIAYFAIFRDVARNKMMAFRRAAQFKGILHRKLVRFGDDALRLVEDNVFKLDQDFDFMIVDGQVWIWRPSGFEFSADMETYVAASAATNLTTISKRIACVNFSPLAKFVAGHKRAMRLIAAIKSRDDLERTSLKRLRAYCKSARVELESNKIQIWPASGHEMDFLLILDRRRYPIQLVDQEKEIYEATSRRRTDSTPGSNG
jgi:Kiwa protein KwaB-like